MNTTTDTNVMTVLDERTYPILHSYATRLTKPVRPILGREEARDQILASMMRPEMSNVILLAPPGTGKTVLVQSVAEADPERIYLEIDLSRMVAALDNPVHMGGMVKQLFDEATAFVRDTGREVVLFIDEFHQIVQMSEAAVEALKPGLAASGNVGLRVIAATTDVEYNTYIAPNQPLAERLQDIRLTQLTRETTIKILRSMVVKNGVEKFFPDDSLLYRIYEVTDRYVPASVAPRQQIRVLDAMIGWHKFSGRAFDDDLLADVLRQSMGVNVAVKVDGKEIENKLNAKVFAQQRAAKVINDRLQICVADLHDKTRPLASFLFTGSTGVGKDLSDDTLVPVLDEQGETFFKRHGDLCVGDLVFNRKGYPVPVTGVFRQPPREFYRITFTNGRTVDASEAHLWPVLRLSDRNQVAFDDDFDESTAPWEVLTTAQLYDKGVCYRREDGRFRASKFFVPASRGVRWPERELPVDPYVMGVFIAGGVMRRSTLSLRISEQSVVNEVAHRLGVDEVVYKKTQGTWLFALNDMLREKYLSFGTNKKAMIYLQSAMLFGDIPEMCNQYFADVRIPRDYMYASFEQRMELVRGLFDAGGYIRKKGYTVHYQSANAGLLEQMHLLLASVGIDSVVTQVKRSGRDGMCDTRLIVHVNNADKEQLFAFSEKKKAVVARGLGITRRFTHNYDTVGIKDITPIGTQQGSCIMVDDPEHLYQAGDFIVTHNTEMVKQLSHLMFGDDRGRLIRFDMSEFSDPKNADLFRLELARQVSAKGYAVILIDEVEKAAPEVYRVLLQVLDDGRLTDVHGRQVSFLNTYIVMTTNVGSSIFRRIGNYAASDTGDGESMTDYEAKIRSTLINEKFPPELLGRIDVLVPFQPLSDATKVKIVKSKLAELRREVYKRHGVRLDIDQRVIMYLTQDLAKDDSDAGGARESVRMLNSEVIAAVATYINAHPEHKKIGVIVKGKLRSEDKSQRVTQGTIHVGQVA